MYAFNSKAIKISRAKFHCNRLTTIQDYASLIFGGTQCRFQILHKKCIMFPFLTTINKRVSYRRKVVLSII